jgi:hypothetical protein
MEYNQFIQTLSGVNKVMYKTAYNFHTKYHEGATPESAHQAGLNEIQRIAKISERESQPQTYVDLSTGRKFTSTEADLISRNS